MFIWCSPEFYLTIIWPSPDPYLTLISSLQLKKSCLVGGGGWWVGQAITDPISGPSFDFWLFTIGPELDNYCTRVVGGITLVLLKCTSESSWGHKVGIFITRPRLKWEKSCSGQWSPPGHLAASHVGVSRSCTRLTAASKAQGWHRTSIWIWIIVFLYHLSL